MLKTDRLDLRMTTDEKGTVEQAAAITGNSTAGFAKAAMLTEARRIIAEANTWALNTEDWEVFTTALATPDDPRWTAFLAEPAVWQR